MTAIQIQNDFTGELLTLDSNILADLNNLADEDWHKLRQKGLGGSDAGSVLGLNPYASAITLFAEKTNKIKRFSGNKHTKFGKKLEPVIRDWFAEDYTRYTGQGIITEELDYMLEHNKHRFIRANLDGLVKLADCHAFDNTGEQIDLMSSIGGLEIKTASINQKKAWEDGEVPDSYYCQIQHYMLVTGLKFFIIVVLLDKELIWRIVPRNEDFIQEMLDKETDFWYNYVVKDVCPEPDGHDSTTETYKEMFSDTKENVVEREDMLGLRDRYKEISGQIKELTAEQAKIKQKFMETLGENETLLVGKEQRVSSKGKEYEKDIKITWKYQKKSIYERVKIGEDKNRVMRIG